MTDSLPALHVSAKVEDSVFDSVCSTIDPDGFTRVTNSQIVKFAGLALKTVKYALLQLESTGRIERITKPLRPGISGRIIRTFPPHHFVSADGRYLFRNIPPGSVAYAQEFCKELSRRGRVLRPDQAPMAAADYVLPHSMFVNEYSDVQEESEEERLKWSNYEGYPLDGWEPGAGFDPSAIEAMRAQDAERAMWAACVDPCEGWSDMSGSPITLDDHWRRV